MIKHEIFRSSAPAAGGFLPFTSLKRRPFLSVAAQLGWFVPDVRFAARKAVEHFLPLFAPHSLRGFRNSFAGFFCVYVTLGVLVTETFALSIFGNPSSRILRMSATPERISFIAEHEAKATLTACFGCSSSDLGRKTIKTFSADLTGKPTPRALTFASSGIRHKFSFQEHSENWVNSVEHLLPTGYEAVSQYRAKPQRAFGAAEGVTARPLSPNNNAAQERPARKGRYSLNSSVTVRSADKKPHDNKLTTPQDGFTSAFFTWSQLAVSVSISRLEERKNSGQNRLLNLLQSKQKQAEVSLRETVNNCVMAGRITASAAQGQFLARIGRLDSNASGPLPLAALIDVTPSRSVSIGNINGNTYSFWRNQATNSTATTFAGLKQEMNQTYNDCSKGAGGSPDLLVGDQRVWETYFNSLQNQERYIVETPRVLDVLGGSEVLKFRGAEFFWDEVVPDTDTNAEVVDGVGTVSNSTLFYLNTDCFDYVVDKDTDFIVTPFITPAGQDARVAEILWMGAMCINNRRKLGTLYSISRSIVA